MKKNDREIMEIFEAFDATECAHSAARLAGVDPKTVRRYARMRDTGVSVGAPGHRTEADRPVPGQDRGVGGTLARQGPRGQGPRAAAAAGVRRGRADHPPGGREAKARWRAGHRRTYRPWITEPGLWLPVRLGCGAEGARSGRAAERETLLFCAWLAWSRFRVVIPTWDRTLPTLIVVHGHHAAAPGWGADVRVDRQREDGDRRARRRGPGAAPGDRRGGPALRHAGAHVCAVRPGVQGRVGGHRPDREGRPGPDRGEPARARTTASPSWSRRCAVFCAAGQHPASIARPARPRRRCWTSNGPACTRCPRPRTPLALGETRPVNARSDGPVRVGALLHPARSGRQRRSGSAPTATNWSSSSTCRTLPVRPGVDAGRRPGWSRSPATPCPRPAGP